MKRDPALVALSHDHHQALRVAQTLRRARSDTANEARAMFLTYRTEHGDPHFRAEEDILLPAFATHGDAHPLVARARCDHVVIGGVGDGVGHRASRSGPPAGERAAGGARARR